MLFRGLPYYPLDEVGYLYVVDSGNNRVVLTLSLSFQGESGSTGIALGQFQGALNLALGGRGIYVADSGNHRVQAFDPIDGGHGTSLTPFHARLALSSEFAIPLNQPCAVAPVPDYLAEKIYIADTANNRVVLAELPFETPEAVWNEMKARVAASDLTGALESFSIRSFDGYREAFFSLGLDQIMSDINAIGALTPVHIENDEAQYYFEQVVEGIPLLFPVQFLKENGVWKILEF